VSRLASSLLVISHPSVDSSGATAESLDFAMTATVGKKVDDQQERPGLSLVRE
jgi:hypothetical protein